MRKKPYHKLCFFFGLFACGIGMLCWCYPVCKKQKEIQIEQQRFDQFFQKNAYAEKEDLYIAVIEIPKIHLKKGLFPIHHPQNQVNRNITILKESDMPDQQKGNFILAAHSGIGEVAYFNHLTQLTLGDSIFIYYHGIQYIYQVSQIYDVEKTGYISIDRDIQYPTLTMITCKYPTNKQLIVIAKQIDSKPYT